MLGWPASKSETEKQTLIRTQTYKLKQIELSLHTAQTTPRDSTCEVMLRLNHVALGGDLCAFLFFQVSGEQFFAEVAKDVLLYVSRDLSDKVSLPFLCAQLLCCFCGNGNFTVIVMVL